MTTFLSSFVGAFCRFWHYWQPNSPLPPQLSFWHSSAFSHTSQIDISPLQSITRLRHHHSSCTVCLRAHYWGPCSSSCALQGSYVWVQGRRANSKVTATSGGRLTNHYAWVTGRLTRRGYLGVTLPLRVPEKVTLPGGGNGIKKGRSYSATLPPETTTSKKSDFSGQDKPFRQI